MKWWLDWIESASPEIDTISMQALTFTVKLINMSRAMRKCVLCHANNKGADQPAHSRSLISAFVVRCLDSVMFLVSVIKISSIMLAFVAEQASMSLIWSETPEDTFSHDVAHIISQ